MQWHGKSTNFSTTGTMDCHSNISWNSGNWIYELQTENLESQNWDEEVKRRQIQKRPRKIINRNEWQRKTSCGHINSNWSLKLVDSTSNYRILIQIIQAAILRFNKTPIWLGKYAIYQHLVLWVVNLIFSTVWVARKMALDPYDHWCEIMIYVT